MLQLRYVVKSLLTFLVDLMGFNRLPGGLYYSDTRFLERMVGLSRAGRGNVIFVKPGFYLYNGDDVAIYSHTEGFSMKADVVSVRWKRVSGLTSEEKDLMGEANISSKYLTLFECRNLRGRLFNDVADTLDFRHDILTFCPQLYD